MKVEELKGIIKRTNKTTDGGNVEVQYHGEQAKKLLQTLEPDTTIKNTENLQLNIYIDNKDIYYEWGNAHKQQTKNWSHSKHIETVENTIIAEEYDFKIKIPELALLIDYAEELEQALEV